MEKRQPTPSAPASSLGGRGGRYLSPQAKEAGSWGKSRSGYELVRGGTDEQRAWEEGEKGGRLGSLNGQRRRVPPSAHSLNDMPLETPRSPEKGGAFMNVPAPPGGLWPCFPYPPGPADISLPCPLYEDPLRSRVTMAISGGGPRASIQDSQDLWKWDKEPESLPFPGPGPS